MSETLPNILLIMSDCARGDKWLGPDRRTVTPTMDRLCQQGVSFPTTIVEKSCTTPSFATLLSGLYSTRHGVHLVWGYRLPDQVALLTEILADNGYHRYAEMTGPMVAEMGLDRGFDEYEYRAPQDYLHTAWGDGFVEKLKSGYYKSPWFLMLHLWELHPKRQVLAGYDRPECGRDDYERSVSSLDAQLARVIEAAGDDAMIIFTGDHGEKTEAETYREGTAVEYARRLLNVDEAEGMVPFHVAQWAGPSVLQQFYGQCTPMMRDIRLREARRKPTFGRWDRLRDRLRLLRLMPMLYLQDLFKLAAPVKLTQLLKKRGLLDPDRARTKMDRFMRSVDKSDLLDMHMRMWTNSYKNNMREGHIIHVYDFLVRVPLVVRWKGHLPEGVVHERMVRQPDILPTVLDLIGLGGRAELADIDGRSFKPLIDGQAWEPLPAYVSLSGLPADLELRGVRTETHKYTFGPHNDELPQELYDLRTDPGETRNIAADEPQRCAELRQIANSMVSARGETPVELMEVSPEQQKEIEQRLRDLGYIE